MCFIALTYHASTLASYAFYFTGTLDPLIAHVDSTNFSKIFILRPCTLESLVHMSVTRLPNKVHITAVVFIEADNPYIGLLCFLAVGVIFLQYL